MKRLIIIVTIVILILLSIIIGIIIKKWKDFKEAISYAWKNNLQCGEPVCPRPITTLAIPNLDTKEDMAKFCADLVVRIETKGKNANVANMQKRELIYYNSNNSPIGIILVNGTTLWIALKGTTTIEEWSQDVKYRQVPVGTKGVMVHEGFNNVCNTILNTVKNSIKNNNPTHVVITGHSLGAALATLLGYYLSSTVNNLIIYTFASPRVGNIKFCTEIDGRISKLYRYVNTCDIIPTLPPSVSPNFNNTTQPYIYTDCGTTVPFTLNWKSLLNNHMMGVYIEGLKNIQYP